MKSTLTSLLLIILFQACTSAASKQHKIENNDNKIAIDEPFDVFKTKLQQAIKNKDITALKPLFADAIMESHDGCEAPGCSQEDFFKIYFTSDTSDDWHLTLTIMRLGFEPTKEFHDEDTLSEYYFAPVYPDRNFNPEKEVYIIQERTNIYEKPTASSKPIAKVVRLDRLNCICGFTNYDAYITQNDTTWIKVKKPGMKYGYTPVQHTSDSIQKYILVKKINGRWKIVEYYSSPGC